MFKLALNAGHGYETAGKRCLKEIDPYETREYALNKRICDKIQDILSGFDGIEILRIDNGNDIPIQKRAAAANFFGADFYLAVHHNAGINGGSGGGAEAYVYLKVDELTKAWQKEIYESTVAHTGLKGNRAQPLRSADLGECRMTRMPAVLLECGFMDSTDDTPVILTEDFARRAAEGCAEAIVSRAGLTKKTTAQNPESEDKKDIETLAREVIMGLWGNGKERKDRIAAAGYDYSAVQSRVNDLFKK